MNDNEKKLEQYLKGIVFDDTPDSAHRDLLEKKLLLNFNTPVPRQNMKWSIIMKTKITKVATIVAVILIVVLGVTFFEESAATAYAIEQTIEANHTIQTIHLRLFKAGDDVENNEYTDCWAKYDDTGLPSNFRYNTYDDEGTATFNVWNEGVAKGWTPAKNVLIIIRRNDAATKLKNFAATFDPKLILERLYDLQENQTVELTIDEPAQDDAPICITAINSVDKTRIELLVDPETKLVMQFSQYRLGEQEDVFDGRIEYLSYNQPIDQSVFELTGIPDDVHVFDQIDQLVGLEKSDLTNNEIAVKVVQEALEATIVQDYDEVSRLMEGDSGDTIEQFIADEFDAKAVKVISTGQPKPHKTWPHILCVPCEIEIEDEEGVRRIVDVTATAMEIGYQFDRWIVHTDLSTNDYVMKGTIVSGEQVGDFTFGMNKDDILNMLGKPKQIFRGGETYTLEALPQMYYMSFGDISFLFIDDSIKEISVSGSHYKFTNGLGVGDSEQKIKQAFGDNFHLRETNPRKDFLIYQDQGLAFEVHKEDRTIMEINVRLKVQNDEEPGGF